jgi:hypothetical protein
LAADETRFDETAFPVVSPFALQALLDLEFFAGSA